MMKSTLVILSIASVQAFAHSGIAVPSGGALLARPHMKKAQAFSKGRKPSIAHQKKQGVRLQAASAANSESKNPISAVAGPALSASALIVIDIAFRRIFQKFAISFPSSLGGCCVLFASLLVLPFGQGIFNLLSPGAGLLAKWLPVFFVPSLITLPLAGGVGSAAEVRTSMVDGRSIRMPQF